MKSGSRTILCGRGEIHSREGLFLKASDLKKQRERSVLTEALSMFSGRILCSLMPFGTFDHLHESWSRYREQVMDLVSFYEGGDRHNPYPYS